MSEPRCPLNCSDILCDTCPLRLWPKDYSTEGMTAQEFKHWLRTHPQPKE